MRDRTISELAEIEFEGSLGEAFYAYSQALQDLARRWAFELELSSGDAEAAMSRLKGHPLLFGVDARVRARRVAKRLKRKRELVHGIDVEAQKFHADYNKHFVDRAGR